MIRISRHLPLIAVLLLAAACGGKGLGAEAAGPRIRTEYGYRVRQIPVGDRDLKPRFSGKTFDGDVINSRDLSGGVTVVNFWASWCGPCRAEQAQLERLWNRFRDRGVRFLGVNTRDTQVDGRAFLDEFGVSYPSIFNRDASVAFAFRVAYMPSTFVLDRQGRVAAVVIGATRSEEQLARAIEREVGAA